MQVYADNAATTKMSRTAIEAMLPYLDEIYGNPSSLHSVGQRAAEALQSAREELTELCQRREKADRQQGRVTGAAVLSAACLLIILLL